MNQGFLQDAIFLPPPPLKEVVQVVQTPPPQAPRTPSLSASETLYHL